MNLIHTKSPCCRGDIRHFGKRRRQCAVCLKTWRIRLKKRGRKRMRAPASLALRFINHELPTLRQLAKRKNHSKDYFQRRLVRSLESYLKRQSLASYELIGYDDPLILVADAMWHRIHGDEWTIYIALLKTIGGDKAMIMPPTIIPGHECTDGWLEKLARIEVPFLNRIKAVVCDGVPTLLVHAHRRGWLIQRCHFHLISSFQNYATTGPRSTNKQFAVTLMMKVKKIITTRDTKQLIELKQYFTNLLNNVKSRGLRRVINGLLRDLPQFRTYLDYPELNLPTTSNSAESAVQMIRDLLYRARGLNSPQALDSWIKALFLAKQTIVCNGNKSTKK